VQSSTRVASRLASDDKAGVEERDPTTAAGLGLTISQAASFLGVSLSTVRRWSDAGVLPGYRTPGGQRRFNRAQLEEFVNGLSRRAS
jgi:excisionase family DNA binding protein